MGFVITVELFIRSQEKARQNSCGPSVPCFLSIQSFRTEVKSES